MARNGSPPYNQRAWGRVARERWVILVLGVVALGGAVYAWVQPRSFPVQVATAAQKTLVVPILCDGILGPEPGGELRAPESGTIAQVLVREGARVREGTVLLRLSNPDLAQRALEGRSLVLHLESERARASGELQALDGEVAHLRGVFEGDERLLAQGALTRLTRDADELALQQATSRRQEARALLDALSQEGEGHSSRLALSQAAARELERRVASLTLKAPFDGVAYGLPRRVGEPVTAGEVVGNVVDPLHLRVRARVDEPDLPRVAPGQRLVASFDGLPDRKWEGKVTLVSPGLREVGGREVGEVLSEISDPELQLPPNASINVQIVAGEKASALVIPRAALYRDGSRRYVYVFRAGRAEARDVSVGLVGLTEVEILSGLSAGERVILPGDFPVSPGLRVSVG
jgi:HlyD family secretion protein